MCHDHKKPGPIWPKLPQASANEEEVLKLQASLDSYQSLVNEQKTMLDRLQRENADMAARITLTEHANGVALHDSYLETEKVNILPTSLFLLVIEHFTDLVIPLSYWTWAQLL